VTKVNGGGEAANPLSHVLGLDSKVRFTTIVRGLPIEIEMEFRLYKNRGELRYQCFSAATKEPLLLQLTKEELIQLSREAAVHKGEVPKEKLT
jgi:hypothetical protein